MIAVIKAPFLFATTTQHIRNTAMSMARVYIFDLASLQRKQTRRSPPRHAHRTHEVGLVVGDAVGEDVGEVVGDAAGEDVGEVVGNAAGEDVGEVVGDTVGDAHLHQQ
jgi:uncharacterized protein YcfJ